MMNADARGDLNRLRACWCKKGMMANTRNGTDFSRRGAMRRITEGGPGMNLQQHFLSMFAYDHWANGECLIAMRKAASPVETVRRMAHVLSAEKLWLERMLGEPQTLPVWPTTTIEECAALADDMNARWLKYLGELSPPAFDRVVEYRNSKGEAWSNRVEDILTHVLMHSAYHRGQIALKMRAAGTQPAYTDFIHAVRQGFLE
jgi:uncharacterized damage-inducible protein DinB